MQAGFISNRHSAVPQFGSHPGLLTDLYHPDAAYISWVAGRNGVATFDLYTRRAPFGGAYLLVAGLEPAIEFVRTFSYSSADLAYLAQIRDYDPAFLDELGRLRFTGDVLAMPEGSIAFANEPLLRITAPFREALLLESGLLNAINLATLIATKAARVVYAAQGRRVAEFAFRRAQEPFVVARSASIGGCASTSFLAAAYRYRLLASGTIPHALVQLFDDERSAFAAVAQAFNRYTLLLDTYDVRQAIHTAIEVAKEYRQALGHTLAAVRLDGGNLLEDSRYVREALDAAGLRDVRVVGSGDLDEFAIAELVEAGAPIDAFGVGTSLGVGAGSLAHEIEGGALGGVYKLVSSTDAAGVEQPRLKRAGEKSTWPGQKEVYRLGDFREDLVALAGEPPPEGGVRLLRPVIRQGELLPGSLPPLSEIWELAEQNLHALPEPFRRLKPERSYPVRFSSALQHLRAELFGDATPDEAPPSPR